MALTPFVTILLGINFFASITRCAATPVDDLLGEDSSSRHERRTEFGRLVRDLIEVNHR